MALCGMAGSVRRRPGFTLVEMLVVLTIIVILTALAFGFLPRLQENQRATRAADQIQGWFLIAKQRALADRRPTGLRAVFDLADIDLSNPTLDLEQLVKQLKVKEIQYVQRPDDFVVRPGCQFDPAITPPNPPKPLPIRRVILNQQIIPSLGTITWNLADLEPPNLAILPPYADYSGGFGDVPAQSWPVQPGDYIEMKGGGLVHRIAGFFPYQSDNNRNDANQKLRLILSSPIQPGAGPTMDYRIVRQPRPLPGEQPLRLPANVVIDGNLSVRVPIREIDYRPPAPIPRPASLPKPDRLYFVEIMFSPSGEVSGQGITANSQIILWLRDSTRDDVIDGQPALVAINTRTGLVSVHPVDNTETRSGSAAGPANLTFSVAANPGGVIKPGSYLLLDKRVDKNNPGPEEVVEVRSVNGLNITVFGMRNNHPAGFSVRPAYTFAQSNTSSGL